MKIIIPTFWPTKLCLNVGAFWTFLHYLSFVLVDGRHLRAKTGWSTLHSYNIQKYLWTLIFNEVLVWKRVCYRVTDVFSCSFLVKQLLLICLEYECMYVNLDPIIVNFNFVLVFMDLIRLNCWTYYYVLHLFCWCGGVSIELVAHWSVWLRRSIRVRVHSAVRAAAQWVCSHSFSSQNSASHQQLLRLAHATQLSIVRPQYHSQLA